MSDRSPLRPLLNLVWLKRDLRTTDHLPLHRAEAAWQGEDRSPGAADEAVDYRILHVEEPSLQVRPDTSPRHRRFVAASLEAMDAALAPRGRRVERVRGEATEVFLAWWRQVRIHTVFSHREHGVQASWDRDRAVARLFRELGIRWVEVPRDGVQRGIRNRVGWDEAWEEAMSAPLLRNHYTPPGTACNAGIAGFAAPAGFASPPVSPGPPRIQPVETPGYEALAQAELPGGEAHGRALLSSFLGPGALAGDFPAPGASAPAVLAPTASSGHPAYGAPARGRGFRRHLGDPQASRIHGSRISPHLAWGTLSLRQVVQAAQATRGLQEGREAGTGPEASPRKRGHGNDAGPGSDDLRSFRSRLLWRSHFIQKFEMECRYETECLNRGYETLGRELRPDFVAAWAEGRTGYPLVDAAMRALQATGWVNFRLRALLVSFLTHHLFQDWRLGAPHMARLFLDFEPGIHYPQFQMQAGVTGTNTIRIYNPVKQSHELDPEGAFVARWVPELAPLPLPWRHMPWRTPPLEAGMAGVDLSRDYPLPLVDHEVTAREARERLWGHRDDPLVQAENTRIARTHLRPGVRRS